MKPTAYYFLPIFICLSSLLFSCKKDNDPTNTEKLFTLTVDATYGMDDAKQYVILSDKNGATIDFKEYTPGSKLEFNKPGTFQEAELTVTFLQVFSDQGSKSYMLATYLNVQKGTQWHLKKTNNLVPTQAGEIKLDLGSLQAKGNEVEISSPTNFLWISQPSLTNQAKYNYPLSKPAENVWVRLANSQASSYFLLEQAQNGQSYSVDFSKFTAGNTQTIVLNKPDFTVKTLLLTGTQDNNQFRLFSNTNQHPSAQSVVLSYPQSTFQQFDLDLSLQKFATNAGSYEEENYDYHTQGPTLLNSLTSLNADFTLENVSLDNFQMTTQGNFDYFGNWYRSLQSDPDLFVDWYVYGQAKSKVSFQLPAIPTSVTDNQELSVKWRETTLYEYASLPSYEDMLKNTTTLSPAVSGNYSSRSKKLKASTL